MFVDTNVLVTASNPNDPNQAAAKRALDRFTRGQSGCFSGQIIREYVSSVSRPIEVYGLGWTPTHAWLAIDAFHTALHMLADTEEGFKQLKRLCLHHHVRGKQIHDANIVATMIAHNQNQLLTFNTKDFTRYAGEIDIVTP